jgi:hypothetical protein
MAATSHLVFLYLDYLYSSCTGKQNIDPTTNNSLIIDLIREKGRDSTREERKGRSVPLLSILNVGMYALHIILASGLQIISGYKCRKLGKNAKNNNEPP